MPYPTIKPLFVALFMTLMFGCLLLIHEDKLKLAITGVILCAAHDDGVPVLVADRSRSNPITR